MTTFRFQVAYASGLCHQADSPGWISIPGSLCSKFKYPEEGREKNLCINQSQCLWFANNPPSYVYAPQKWEPIEGKLNPTSFSHMLVPPPNIELCNCSWVGDSPSHSTSSVSKKWLNGGWRETRVGQSQTKPGCGTWVLVQLDQYPALRSVYCPMEIPWGCHDQRKDSWCVQGESLYRWPWRSEIVFPLQ